MYYLMVVSVAREDEDITSSLLFDLGTRGIVTLKENEREVDLGAYFDSIEPSARLEERAKSSLSRSGLLERVKRIEVHDEPDQDWLAKWKEGFEPIAVGARLIIAPSWRVPEDPGGRLVVEIDPGMAFGTGTHETTRLCLAGLQTYWKGGRLLDVGTGTGILAIAAAKLAPGSAVTALDVDPEAVGIARKNAEINQVSNSVEVFEGRPEMFCGSDFDIIVANLTAEAIIDEMKHLVGCLSPQGALILSGILSDYAGDVRTHLSNAGLDVVEESSMEEWTAIVAQWTSDRPGPRRLEQP